MSTLGMTRGLPLPDALSSRPCSKRNAILTNHADERKTWPARSLVVGLAGKRAAHAIPTRGRCEAVACPSRSSLVAPAMPCRGRGDPYRQGRIAIAWPTRCLVVRTAIPFREDRDHHA
jgi:hypothetical protein